MSLEEFFNQEIEPMPICENCDSRSGGLKGHWHCMNHQSPKCGPLLDFTDGCKKFFPDSTRWPEADHD